MSSLPVVSIDKSVQHWNCKILSCTLSLRRRDAMKKDFVQHAWVLVSPGCLSTF